jgi:hypothetical protein
MAALNFPSSPTVGQVYTANGLFYTWDGVSWDATNPNNITGYGLYENSATIGANYTIGTGNNAMSAGPITISSGFTVTVPTGSVWTIV